MGYVSDAEARRLKARCAAIGKVPRLPLPEQLGTEVLMYCLAPALAMSGNKINRGSPHAHKRHKTIWYLAGLELAEEYAEDLAPLRGCALDLVARIPEPPRIRKRDSPNYAEGSFKPFLDGFSQSGIVIPGDDDTWIGSYDVRLWQPQEFGLDPETVGLIVRPRTPDLEVTRLVEGAPSAFLRDLEV